MSTVTFTVTIPAQRARTGTIEHCIEEALRAVAGADTHIFTTQIDDTTLQVTIHGRNDKAIALMDERGVDQPVEYPLNWGRPS